MRFIILSLFLLSLSFAEEFKYKARAFSQGNGVGFEYVVDKLGLGVEFERSNEVDVDTKAIALSGYYYFSKREISPFFKTSLHLIHHEFYGEVYEHTFWEERTIEYTESVYGLAYSLTFGLQYTSENFFMQTGIGYAESFTKDIELHSSEGTMDYDGYIPYNYLTMELSLGIKF
jgi:hypothetical protein